MGVAVGIDLGTTNTVVAVMRDGQPVTLADEGGRKLIPSFVAFHPSGKVLVGESAKDRRVVDPTNTIYSVKRLIGRTYASDEVQRALKTMPFEIVEGDKQGVRVIARGEVYTLPEISAFVLRRAKAVAESALGEVVDRAVITVPANFNDPQRAATKLAGKLAGLDVLRILNEPTAAALAYGLTASKAERIAVYDLGGGTFDVTLLDLSGDVFEVIATGGDTSLGGDDIDQAIAAEMTKFFLEKFRFDPRPDPTARALLRARAEKLKHALSEREDASIELNDVVRGEGGAFVPATFSMDRKRLDVIAGPFIERTIETCRFSIETIGVETSEVERVLLVGGATRMPLVARRVEEYFQRPAAAKVNPDEVVAQGAAVQAAALTKTSAKVTVSLPATSSARANVDKAPHASVTTQLPAASAIVAPVLARPQSVPPRVSKPLMGPSPRPPAVAAGHTLKGPVGLGPARQKPPALPQPAPPARAGAGRSRDPQEDASFDSPFGDDGSSGMAPSRNAVVSTAYRQPVTPPIRSPISPPVVPPDPLPRTAPADADIDSALREFMFEDAEAVVTPRADLADSSADERPVPSFDFDLDITPPIAKPRAMPTLSPSNSRAPSASRAEPPGPQRGHAPPPLPLLAPTSPLAERDVSLAPPPVMFESQLDTQSERPFDADLEAALPAPDLEPLARRPVAPPTPPRAAPLLIDVTPISLGVEVAGGFCDFLIRANTPVPCDRTRIFRTASDNQVAVRVRVVQGESQRFSENTYLGDLELSGLRAAPRGEVEVAVTFEIDADGILNVRAKEEQSGRETVARMNLLGAQTDTEEVAAMMARQRKHEVA